MNDIDLTSWISANSNTKGWLPVGRNSTDPTYIDGDGHTISGLWIDTTEDYSGLFSSYLTGYIKNLNVETTSKGVKGGDYTGILIGKIEGGQILNCNVKGNAVGTVNVGGIAGYTASATLNNNTYSGKISSGTDNSYIGGIAGFAGSSKSSNNKATVSIEAKGNKCSVGGLFGRGSEITNGFADVQITSSGKNCLVGGLAGDVHSPIKFSYSVGSINVSGTDSYTGGLVGKTDNSINDSYSSANVTGTLYTAGLVACNTGAINRCYASGNVDGIQYGAGLVAELVGANAKSSNSVAANNIVNLTSPSSWGCRVIGGFKDGCAEPELGSNLALKTMQVSLNNIPQNKKDDNIEGVAKTENELKSSATYSSLGWNMTDVWTIEEGENYPTLKWDTKVVPTAISVKSISLNKTSLSLKEGETATLVASILPENATDKTVTWKSSNTSVVTIDNGKVVALKAGNATITVTANDGSKVNASCPVTVSSTIVMYSVTASSADESMGTVSGSGEYANGNEVTLIATPAEGYEFVKWSDDTTENPYIFTITEDISISAIFKLKQSDTHEDASSTDISQMTDVLYSTEMTSKSGGQIVLPIYMKNSAAVTLFQTNVYLPEGFSFAKKANGKYAVSLIKDRITDEDDNHVISANLQQDGSLLILCSSQDNYTFDGNDGKVATVTIDVADDVVEGKYLIKMNKQKMVRPDNTGSNVAEYQVVATVKNFTLGDVNDDGDIDGYDLVGISNLILGTNTEGLNRDAADVNQDTEIDGYDYVMEVNTILSANAAPAKNLAKAVTSESELSALNLSSMAVSVGEQAEMTVGLECNGDVFTLVQTDIEFPAGIEPVLRNGRVVVKLADECRDIDDDHAISCVKQSNGKYRVLVMSQSNTGFNGSNGKLFSINVETASDMYPGMYDVTLSNTKLVRANNTGVNPSDCTAAIICNGTTGISDIDAEQTEHVMYNLNGQRVSKYAQRGIYISNGKKNVKK